MNIILEGISLAYITAFFIAVYCGQGRLSKIHINFLPLFFLGLAFATIAFNIMPKTNGWDLAGHYKLVEQMREAGTMNVPRANEVYRTEPVAKFLYYITSLLPENNYFQFIAISVEFINLCFLFSCICKKKALRWGEVSLFLMLIFGLCPLYQYISGVRTALATSFLAYALYRDIGEKKRGGITLLFYIMAITTHTFTIVIVILRLTMLFKKIIWNYRCFLLIWGIGLTAIISLNQKVAAVFPFFNKFSAMVQSNSKAGITPLFTTNFKYDFIRIMIIVILLILTEMTLKYYRKSASPQNIGFLEFFIILSYFSLGSIVVYLLFDRMCIIIAWNALLPIYCISNTRRTAFRYFKTVSFLGIMIGSAVLFLFNIRHLMVYSIFKL